MNKYHFFVVYIRVSRDRLLKFPWRHLVLISLATLKKNNCFSVTKYAKRWMNEKTIQCLPNPSQHIPIYLQQFQSYTMLKSMRKSKNRYFYHIFVFPGNASGTITLNVVWMEREFDAYKLSRWVCPSNYNRFSDRARYWSKIAIISYPLAFDAPIKGVAVGTSPSRFARKN